MDTGDAPRKPDAPADPAPDRPPVLDYAQPQAGEVMLCARSASRAILVALAMQFLIFILYAPSLDGGATMKRCAATCVGYWVVAALIIWRRRFKPTWADLLYIAIGYPVILATTEYFAGR